jgi:serine protease
MKLNLYLLVRMLCCILLLSFMAQAQQKPFYYSNKKKFVLTVDSASIQLRYTKEGVRKEKSSQYKEDMSIESIDTTYNKDLVRIRFKDKDALNKVLRKIKKDSDVQCVSLSMDFAGTPLIPTGLIVYKTPENISFEQLIDKLALKDKVQLMPQDSIYNYTVIKPVNEDSLFEIANRMYESNLVDWCHPDFYIPLTSSSYDPVAISNTPNVPFTRNWLSPWLVPTDPGYANQYYLKNPGGSSGTLGMDLNVEKAWEMITGSPFIRVAVVDQGVEDHPEFAGGFFGSRLLTGYTSGNPSGFGAPETATSYHGMACAGVIAAAQNNSIGMSGVAPGVKIVPVNIFHSSTVLTMAQGIDWAWNYGLADVISSSTNLQTQSTTGPDFDLVRQAFTNAATNGRSGKGTVIVNCTGNFSYTTGVAFPANLPEAIPVGAVDRYGIVYGYSDRGNNSGVVAVSSDIVASLSNFYTLDRTGANGQNATDYTTLFGGTSAACPQVAGVAALIFSTDPDRVLTSADVKNIIYSTAKDLGTPGFDNNYGYGLVDACAAVTAALRKRTITGADHINTSEDYIVNLPAIINSTVVWSASPAGIVTVTNITAGGPSTARLTKINNGVVTLMATGTGPCGNIVYTKRVSVGTASLRITPNPAISTIQVSINDGVDNVSKVTNLANNIKAVEIIDKITGKIFLQRKFPDQTNLIKVDISTLKEDVYIIRVLKNDGQWLNGKLIVNKQEN